MDEIQSIFQSLKLKHYVRMNIILSVKLWICFVTQFQQLVWCLKELSHWDASFEYLKYVFEIWYKYLKHFYLEVRYL